MDIELKVGIPGELVTHSFLGLGLREKTYSGGDKALLTGSFSVATRTWIDKRVVWTETKEYKNDSAVQILGRPPWRRALKTGSVPVAKGTLTRTADNLGISHAQNAEVSNLRIVVDGGNPLFVKAPNINADLLLQIRAEPGGFAAKLTGTHDQFPAYTLHVNGTLLYDFDPEAAGTTPDSLFGLNSQTVVTTWRVFAGV